MKCFWERLSPFLQSVYSLSSSIPLLGRAVQFRTVTFVNSWNYPLCYCGLFRKLLPTHMFWIASPMFLFSSFSVSGFNLQSLTHFKLILVQGERYGSSFIILQMAIQFCQHHFLARGPPFQCMFLTALSDIRCVALCLGPCFILPVYESALMHISLITHGWVNFIDT